MINAKRIFHELVLLAAISVTAVCAQPNFIFYIVDDISPEDTSCYGGPVPTPNLERMAAQGIKFSNAYVTASSCSPSRCSIITSRYPHNTGAPELHMALPNDQWKFPGRLRRNGYYSELNGKNHMDYDGARIRPELLKQAFDRMGDGGLPGGEEEWIELIRNRPEDKPFFFWFGSRDAHRKWQINDKAPVFLPEDVEVPPYLFDGPQTREDLAGYYHEVARADFYLGLLLDELEASGLDKNTYLIFCSDNGKPFPRCKTRLYDSGSRVPMLIVGPTVPKGVEYDKLVSTIDIGPTVLDLAGVVIPHQFQGVSLVPVFKNAEQVVRDYVFAEHNWHTYPANERMVRYKNWVYIRNYRHNERNLCAESTMKFPAGKELWDAEDRGELSPEQRDVFLNPRPFEELYNVEKDPHQFKNLTTSPEYEVVLQKLRGVMDEWREQTGDSIPENPTSDIGHIKPRQRGEMPGAAKNASHVLHSGPIRENK